MILNAMGTVSGKHFGLDVWPSKIALPETRVKNRSNGQLVKNKKFVENPENRERVENPRNREPAKNPKNREPVGNPKNKKHKENRIPTPKNISKPENFVNSKHSKSQKKKKDKKYYYDYRNYSSDINTTNAFQNFFLNNNVPNLYVRRPDFSLLERRESIDYRFGRSARLPVMPPFIPETSGMPPSIEVSKKPPTLVLTNVSNPMAEIPKSFQKNCDQTPIVFLPAEKEITTPNIENKIVESSLQSNNSNDKSNWIYYILILAAVAILFFFIFLIWK
jgi:hypothetical protein